MNDLLGKRIGEQKALLDAVQADCDESIDEAVQAIVECYRNGGGVFVFGNGGSAADAMHIVGELNGRYLKDRPGLRAQSLVSDMATLTSLANDYGYDQVFARQLEANGKAGDIAWGLSTSGNSANVVNALQTARLLGMKTLAITGQGGGRCAEHADVLITIPSTFTPHIQEAGTLLYHCICECVEEQCCADRLNS